MILIDGTAPNMEPVDDWLVCLGCYATREPMSSDRDCACVLGGFDAPDGQGVLDAERACEWVRRSDMPERERRMTFGPEAGR